LFREAGFATPEAFASVGREPYRLGAQRLLLVAARAG
jgi:hypothetical protein